MEPADAVTLIQFHVRCWLQHRLTAAIVIQYYWKLHDIARLRAACGGLCDDVFDQLMRVL